MLFHFGRTRNVYVATSIILFSSIKESSATSDYVYVAATDAPAKLRCELVEMCTGLRYRPSLFQTVVLNDVACNHESFSFINFIFPCFKLFSQLYYGFYSLYGNIFELLFMFLFIVSARE